MRALSGVHTHKASRILYAWCTVQNRGRARAISGSLSTSLTNANRQGCAATSCHASVRTTMARVVRWVVLMCASCRPSHCAKGELGVSGRGCGLPRACTSSRNSRPHGLNRCRTTCPGARTAPSHAGMVGPYKRLWLPAYLLAEICWRPATTVRPRGAVLAHTTPWAVRAGPAAPHTPSQSGSCAYVGVRGPNQICVHRLGKDGPTFCPLFLRGTWRTSCQTGRLTTTTTYLRVWVWVWVRVRVRLRVQVLLPPLRQVQQLSMPLLLLTLKTGDGFSGATLVP